MLHMTPFGTLASFISCPSACLSGVDTCPLTKFEGGLSLLRKVDDDTVIRLEATATAALAK